MKDKLEPNMYVRTKDGKIAKFIKYDEEDKEELITDYYEYSTIWIKDVIKASHNIIDLIEVGDYVNGSKVIDISIIGKDKEKWVWVEQMEDSDNKYGDDYVGYNNDQIKSIVTKEQFESMKYKIDRQLKRMEEENK